MQSKGTSRAAIYNVICETHIYVHFSENTRILAPVYMGPSRTHIFGHLFCISLGLSLREYVAI